MKYLILILFFTLSTGFAQTQAEKIERVYRATDKNFDLDCYYAFNKRPKLIEATGPTQRNSSEIYRRFKILADEKETFFTFKVFKDKRRYRYSAKFENGAESSNKLKERSFYLSFTDNSNFNNQIEIGSIVCNVNFAYAKPYVLTDGDYHISVHPYLTYDPQNKLGDVIPDFFKDSDMKSLFLLEAGNMRGNLVNIDSFLSGNDITLPKSEFEDHEIKLDIPKEIPLIVSPAGHNRYVFKAKKQLNIHYTGGNHNYCIWNNTRKVLESFMRSNSHATVNIIYDTHAIVAQKGGIIPNTSFKWEDIYRSNLLVDLLADPEVAAGYHKGYFNYFQHIFFNEFKGMFKKLTLNYQAGPYSMDERLTGTGDRELTVNFVIR